MQKFTPFLISVDNEHEASALLQLIDAGNRHLGAQGAGITQHWLVKINGAREIANAAIAETNLSREMLAKSKRNGKRDS